MSENRQWIHPRKCETGACWSVVEVGDGMVGIHGLDSPWIAAGWAVDTVEAWRKFRDDIKAGALDHIGETQ